MELYINNSLHCFNCQKFGHSKKVCKGREICAKCGQAGHNGSPDSNDTRCPDCSGSHTAFSKECPKWIFEKRVQKIKEEKNILFAQARKVATGENESRPSLDTHTVAEVVRPMSEPSPPATHSIKIQTELTWPDNQETPTTAPTSTCTSQTLHTKQRETSTQISVAMTSSAAANSPVRPNRRGKERKLKRMLYQPLLRQHPTSNYQSPQTHSIHTQTDITWPLTSEQPITKEEMTTQTTSEPVGGTCLWLCSSAASTSADVCRYVTNAIPHLIAPRVSSSPSTALTRQTLQLDWTRGVKRGSMPSAQALPLLLVLVLGRQPNLPLKRKTKRYQGVKNKPKLPPPSPSSEDPVTMYNKYGVLDQEGDDSETWLVFFLQWYSRV